MNEELISVVIPTYKRINELERAIISVINQTYKNLEIIVVDDNANFPDVREKVDSIIKKYPQIKYFKNEQNLGGALTRNVGIEKANGKYIAFLDDDDEYTQEKIEKQYKCYLEHKNEKVGLIYCHHYRKNSKGEIFGEYYNNHGQYPLYENMLKCIAATSLWFCPKNVLLDVGMFEDSPCKQDSIVLLKILGKGYNIFKVPENLVYYYEYEDNKISGTKKSNIEGLRIYISWCRKYYNQLTKKQIKNVEYNFSKDLLTLYVFNNMKKEEKKELINMLKLKPFNKKNLLGLFKYLFPKLYFKLIKRSKK